MLKYLKYFLVRFFKFPQIILCNDIFKFPCDNQFGMSRGTPIDRHYINKFFKQTLINNNFDNVLEVGDNYYSNKFCNNSLLHILEYKKNCVGILCNNKLFLDLECKNILVIKKFDCIILPQTINFIFDLQTVKENLFKLLNPGGQILITSGFISQISMFDYSQWGEYWRLTDKAIYSLFNDKKIHIKTFNYGNYIASQAFLKCICVEDFKSQNVLNTMDINYPIIFAAIITKNI